MPAKLVGVSKRRQNDLPKPAGPIASSIAADLISPSSYVGQLQAQRVQQFNEDRAKGDQAGRVGGAIGAIGSALLFPGAGIVAPILGGFLGNAAGQLAGGRGTGINLGNALGSGLAGGIGGGWGAGALGPIAGGLIGQAAYNSIFPTSSYGPYAQLPQRPLYQRPSDVLQRRY